MLRAQHGEYKISINSKGADQEPKGKCRSLGNKNPIQDPITNELHNLQIVRSMTYRRFNIAILFISLISTPLFAEMPPPSRTVFKCDVNGEIVYSDSPCLGAKRLNIVPTRGVNRLSGHERIGADVRRELRNEAMADALRPLFGENAEQQSKRHRRARLKPHTQARCGWLEAAILSTEVEEGLATRFDKTSIQKKLYRLRIEFRDLNC